MRALVVDDDADVRTWLELMLEAEGWEVDLAASGQEGLESLEASTPDLIVLDQMMPGMIGTEMAQAARKSSFDGPILLFSGFLSDGLLKEAEKLNLIPISKVDVNGLTNHIRSLARQLEADSNGHEAGT